jgi:hypothetical protein
MARKKKVQDKVKALVKAGEIEQAQELAREAICRGEMSAYDYPIQPIQLSKETTSLKSKSKE